MNLSRLVTFIIGVVLAIFGLFLILQHYNDLVVLVVGLVLVVVGLVVISGKVITV